MAWLCGVDFCGKEFEGVENWTTCRVASSPLTMCTVAGLAAGIGWAQPKVYPLAATSSSVLSFRVMNKKMYSLEIS